MNPISANEMHFIPGWLFEQDFLVFLSFFGWMLIGLLAWTKPLSGREGGNAPWLWFGYFGFSQAIAEFFKVLSFSDPFFRLFNFGSAFEMLGFGVLIDMGLRSLPRFRDRSIPPYASIACCLMGFALQVEVQFFTQFVAFGLAAFATSWAGRIFLDAAKAQRRRELIFVLVGLGASLIAWMVDPQRLALVSRMSEVDYGEYPYYGFMLLSTRVFAAWTILFGFWAYRLEMRMDEVLPAIAEQLRFWGFKVLPGALAVIVAASYLITTWNGRRVQDSMEQDYLFRSQTAALALDPDSADLNERGFRENLTNQLLAIRKIGTGVLHVYVWRGDHRGVRALSFDQSIKRTPVMRSTYKGLRRDKRFLRSEAILVGPIVSGGETALSVSSPILDSATGEPAYWLAIDLSASSWMKNVSMARLQTIIIAGLLLALVVFFLYYQVVHESEADLALAKERAEAGDRAKSEFLAVISHEIRTPLQSVLGYSALLRGTPLNEKQLSCLDTIQSEGKMLLRIVQDILDFSNLRKASFELRDDSVKLRKLIEETFRTIQPMGAKTGLEATLEMDDSIPEAVVADGVRLRQVLLNLFGNSVKYTEKGSVELKAETIIAPCNEEDDTKAGVRFTITDTGIGIKEDDLERLFEPFIQLEHTSHYGREGAGLGLAIVSRIAELMGGKIEVESEFGKGSVFTVSFKFDVLEAASVEEVHEGDFSQTEVQNIERMGDQYPLRILVADDNPMIRNLIAQYLDTLGYKPDLVDGGRPAADKGAAYDLVIIDLRMPGIDGPTAATMIREKAEADDVPWMIGVSATLAEAEIEHALSSGIN
ncbi:MAG: ATP-binding protein, partial [Verrucomicrobiota bacterium]